MKPCVLIGSCHNEVIPPLRVVRGILELGPDDELCPSVSPIENVTAYPWSIRTKYYEASIDICTMNSRSLVSKEFAESVNAIIICFDADTSSDLSLVEQWLPFVKEFEPEVKILVCECCSKAQASSITNGICINKVSVQKWCVDHGFELVELNPVMEEEDEDIEDDFPECLGMKRIIQALHAHLWPNLTLLEKKKPQREVPDSAVDVEPSAPAASTDNSVDQQASSMPTAPTSNTHLANKIESLLEETLGGSEETFEELFGKLSEMKLKTAAMSSEERRAYAEKMAISFWKSMGGNDSEVEGLSDED